MQMKKNPHFFQIASRCHFPFLNCQLSMEVEIEMVTSYKKLSFKLHLAKLVSVLKLAEFYL